MSKRKDLIHHFLEFEEDIPGHMKLTSNFSPGPKVLIVGGTHGNEACGVEAIVEWHKRLIESPHDHLSGEVHFLLGNVEAFKKDVRYVDYDLNRSFSRSYSSQKVESLRSREISTFLKGFDQAEAVMDLHSVSKGNSQMLIYNRDQKDVLPFLVNLTPMDTHLNYSGGHIPGLLIDECQHFSKRNLAIECGNHSDPNASKVASYHIYRLLSVLGMISTDDKFEAYESYVNQNEKVDLFETICPIIPEQGFEFSVAHHSTMTFLKEGTVFAKSNEGEQIAPSDCYLVMPPEKIQKTDIDAGFLCHKHTIKRSDYTT